MIELAGQRVTVRCDPDNLHSDIHVYLASGEYFGAAPVYQAAGFFDKAGAERRGKLEKDHRRKVRAAEEAHGLLRADQLAELLSGPSAPAPKPIASVVRAIRHRGPPPLPFASILRRRPSLTRPPSSTRSPPGSGCEPSNENRPRRSAIRRGLCACNSKEAVAWKSSQATARRRSKARSWLAAHKEESKSSWTHLGKLTDVAPSTLSLFATGKYAGNNATVAAKVLAYRSRLTAQAELAADAPAVPEWHETPTSLRLMSLFRWARPARSSWS